VAYCTKWWPSEPQTPLSSSSSQVPTCEKRVGSSSSSMGSELGYQIIGESRVNCDQSEGYGMGGNHMGNASKEKP